MERLFEWWWLDPLIAAAVVAVLAREVDPGTGVDILGAIPLADRQDAYSDLITITTFLAGFSTVAFTVYLGWSSRGVATVRRLVGDRLLKMWIGALALPWLAAMTIWVAKVMDRGDVPPAAASRWIAVAAVLVVATSVARTVVVFVQLAGIEMNPAPATRPVAATPITRRRRSA